MKTRRSSSATKTRIGFAFLAAVIVATAMPGEAWAKHWKHAARHHGSRKQLQDAQASIVRQPTRLGPMRYYGGPKSPMWRAPAEN